MYYTLTVEEPDLHACVLDLIDKPASHGGVRARDVGQIAEGMSYRREFRPVAAYIHHWNGFERM
jgi:hypothetical protein